MDKNLVPSVAIAVMVAAIVPSKAGTDVHKPDSSKIEGPASAGAGSQTFVPPSSREAPGDIGRRAHTNYEIEVPSRRIDGPAPP